MRTFWKFYQVYFPIKFMPSTFDHLSIRSEYFSKDWSEAQQSTRGSNSHAKLYKSTMFHGARYTWLER